MAFTPAQKRAHRAKPEVRAKQRAYKREWDQENKQRRTQYMRDWRSGKVGGGSTTTATPPTTTTNQGDLFDAGST
jgi:hypothetical protein